MNSPHRTVAAACIVVGLAAPCQAGQVKLEIRNGLVTLDATEASLPEILAEWARVGQTRVVNAERVQGAPMTVQLTAVPERQALETLLRSAAGYVAAPRPVPLSSGSMFDRIMLMPGTRPTVVPTFTGSTPASLSGPMSQPARMRDRAAAPSPVVPDDPNEDLPPNAPGSMPAGSVGAPQPGMPTSPLGPSPFGNAYNPTLPPNSAVQSPGPTAPAPPQSAPRPGMPTTPIKPPVQPGEIK
jgi:hypothetical protein